MRYREILTFPIALRREAAQPLHEQIADQIAAAVETGTARRGARIPSTRTLADLLGVSRGVVDEAYDILHSRGYLTVRPGSGTFVRPEEPVASRPRGAVSGTRRWIFDFRPGQLCGEAFPIRAWRAAWRHASYEVPAAADPPALGMPELRRAIADHLAQTRGIVAAEHEVVITSGTVAGLRLVLEAMAGHRVAMERPMPPALLRLATDPLNGFPSDVPIAVVCPDGNRPLGMVMSAQRRAEALAWARCGGTLISLNRDAVFRPEVAGLPRLLEPGAQTVLVGGFGEVLTPTLKLGYAVVPKDLAARIGQLVHERGLQPPDLTQLAVARLLNDGTMVRQMHRLTHLYASKRALLPAARFAPAEAGTVLMRHPDAEAIANRLHDNGIRVETLGCYGVSEPPALVLGFGHLRDKLLRKAIEHLLDRIEERS
ncbi:GntR family transcriptional regulator [Rhizocola hellebori]|uniref:GntR family transcriptional regulator n=1 Tax=Rhizocola hellebori TaxID=1392758 RepID=A0A8J3Q1L6_9ACTN|nr:PLP-dependent aminotransferase family protein [Rhizocola hellebori]GIH01949.1 GntR family transcriptional regulator [Rhizocola hellebori]